MEAAKVLSDADPMPPERVGDVFITKLYGSGTAEGGPRPLIRLSIVEIQLLLDVALDLCSEHPDDPSAARQDPAGKLQRKRPGPTIFGLVDGTLMETVGSDIIMYGRTVLTDPES